MTINGNIIRPEEGKLLKNNDTYSELVYLGIHDSPRNWHEVPAEDVFNNLTSEETLDILLGNIT